MTNIEALRERLGMALIASDCHRNMIVYIAGNLERYIVGEPVGRAAPLNPSVLDDETPF